LTIKTLKKLSTAREFADAYPTINLNNSNINIKLTTHGTTILFPATFELDD